MLTYILIFHIPFLAIQDSMDFFTHFRIDRMLSLVSYLLRQQTLDLFYTKACTVFEESFVQEKIYEPYLLALQRLKALRIYLREEKRRTRVKVKEITIPIFMNVLNRAKRNLKNPPPTPEGRITRKGGHRAKYQSRLTYHRLWKIN